MTINIIQKYIIESNNSALSDKFSKNTCIHKVSPLILMPTLCEDKPVGIVTYDPLELLAYTNSHQLSVLRNNSLLSNLDHIMCKAAIECGPTVIIRNIFRSVTSH